MHWTPNHECGDQPLAGRRDAPWPAAHLVDGAHAGTVGRRVRQARWPDKNLHTDPVAAAHAGLSAVVVSDTQWEGYVVGLLVNTFGVAWFEGGIIDIKIPRSVKIGETLQPGLCLEALIEANGQTRAHVKVWCRNVDGEDVMAGTASCVVPHLGNTAGTVAANAPARA